MSTIELTQVCKSFIPGFLPRKRQILFDLSFEVGSGEVFGFLGPNGAGKTTAIKLIVGLTFPDRGTVLVSGRPTYDHASRRSLGFLPENPYFYDYLTGREFLDFHGRLCGLDRTERQRRSDELTERLDLRGAADVSLRRYSKGMLQRVGFAQALIGRPSLLILDEPMSGLDPIGRRLFRDLIFEERRRGTTIFFSSHILQDAELICDRVAILDRGRLRSVGVLSELLTKRAAGGYEVELAGEGAIEFGAEVHVVGRGQGRTLVSATTLEAAERAIAIARDSGLRLISLVPARATLEDVFLSELDASEVRR